jgi:lipopolysaccharide export LptBFGC system permease protein LptF
MSSASRRAGRTTVTGIARMHKTLFFYLFKDLLKVFLLASGALAGIMSFGGLLRPLTQHGLDLAQVGQMLGYFMPAMTNYSWPIAALFATTFVYGRLSADNELTACRAAGMSYFNILIPAGVLGTIVTLLSAFFLSYVVPNSFLKAERVVYTNMAKLVAGNIDRTQRINLNSGEQSITIFARRATVLEIDPSQPQRQGVELSDVSIVQYLNEKQKDQPKVPEDFYLADTAIAWIEMPAGADSEVKIRVELFNGAKIPRYSPGRSKPLVEASIQTSQLGPFSLQSPVRETSKFMDFGRLTDLRAHPEKSRRILRHLDELTRIDQSRAYIDYLFNEASSSRQVVLSDIERGARYVVNLPANASIERLPDRVIMTSGTAEKPGITFRCESDQTPFTGAAREVILGARPEASEKRVYTRLEVRDATLLYQNEEAPLQSKEWHVPVAMPPSIEQLSSRSVWEYLKDDATSSKERIRKLRSDVHRQQNQIESELHARFSFALSCLILSIVGAAIGMMFRSGNFVSAFAVSVGPALLCIVLIVTGQHVAEAMPREINGQLNDPTRLGLSILWAGNALVTALGIGLYYKLSRT